MIVIADGIEEVSSIMARADAHVIAVAGVMLCFAIVLVVPYGLDSGVAAVQSPADQFRNWYEAYQHQVPLRDVDTGRLRPPSFQREEVQVMVPLIRQDCDAFVTLGADLSWYLLANQRPPSGFNQPAWYAYLDGREESATVAALTRSSRVCVIVGDPVGLRRGGRIVINNLLHVDGPLLRYLEGQNWEVLGLSGNLQLLRTVPP